MEMEMKESRLRWMRIGWNGVGDETCHLVMEAPR